MKQWESRRKRTGRMEILVCPDTQVTGVQRVQRVLKTVLSIFWAWRSTQSSGLGRCVQFLSMEGVSCAQTSISLDSVCERTLCITVLNNVLL